MLDGDANFEPANLKEAWSELSYIAFGVWVRLQNLDFKLDQGVTRLAKYLNMSQASLARVTNELSRSGYIYIERTPAGHKDLLVLVRRAVIYGDNTFVKLSHIREMEFEDYTARLNHRKS